MAASRYYFDHHDRAPEMTWLDDQQETRDNANP